MEKASNNNNNNSKKLSTMLQKALTIGHSATPFSPVRDFRHKRTISTASRGYFFSSPLTPLLPTSARARRRTKSNGGVVVAEPASPKVSCIGQIKLAKSKRPEKITRAAKNLETSSSSLVKEEGKGGGGGWSKLKRLFSKGRTPSRKSSAAVIEHPVVAVEEVGAPSLDKMKKFATSRESLGGFDWSVEMKRQEDESRVDHRRGYSADEEEKMIPCSVSMPLSQREGLSLCPREKSEVNLWERRTVDRPKPLQVKSCY
ncbi:unnamed protein product [Eruca vesicaria subsp. sativa]|uniref:Uncharacterized protein n=1 Tax=Eruca vesicaria subsp. sativa TaxID=29727 RepID=A0ABC8LPN5_ERUVS|nr:unnamed protein product [Eruca vesicaria subsp. sativa]